MWFALVWERLPGSLVGLTTGNDGLKRPAEGLVEAKKVRQGILEALDLPLDGERGTEETR